VRITIANIVDHKISVFDASMPMDGSGRSFQGVFDYNEDSGHIGWFNPDNPLDPWSICEALVAAGFARKQSYGPGFYGHVDYYVTPAFRAELAQQEAEAQEHYRQQEAEIAAEMNIPQHLVW
jgi:hypothetical protein